MILEFLATFLVVTVILNLTIWPGFPFAYPPSL